MRNRYEIIDNYIYIYQLGVYIIIPVFPDEISDNLGSSFATENILARTAPVYSYSSSGPRTVPITLKLHRDLTNDLNASNFEFINAVGFNLRTNTETGREEVAIDEDYVDTLVRYLQAMALPSYTAAINASSTFSSMVNPPMIAVRFGDTIFIKGIIAGDVQVTYSGALDANGKYSEVAVSFTVTEVEPQDAEQLAKWGSFRGLNTVMMNGLFSKQQNT